LSPQPLSDRLVGHCRNFADYFKQVGMHV